MGEGGVPVRRGRRPGGGLRSPRSPGDGAHHRRLHGGVRPQESDLVAEAARRLGEETSALHTLFTGVSYRLAPSASLLLLNQRRNYGLNLADVDVMEEENFLCRYIS